jgi:hypothetical protein
VLTTNPEQPGRSHTSRPALAHRGSSRQGPRPGRRRREEKIRFTSSILPKGAADEESDAPLPFSTCAGCRLAIR